jgi:trafficking protein particle complex subunit 12
VLPFELEIMHARLKYWAADHLGYLDALVPLLRKCKTRARAAGKSGTVAMWKERGARVSLTIASQLVEMKVRIDITRRNAVS